MQRGTWLVERCFCDKPKVVTSHSGVSYACLLVPVVKHLPPRAGAGALGKGKLMRVCFLGHFHSAENLHTLVCRGPKQEFSALVEAQLKALVFEINSDLEKGGPVAIVPVS